VVKQGLVGVHWDIEPHALPEWDTDMNKTANWSVVCVVSLASVQPRLQY
jgi:uncharacterized membrane protein